MTDDLNLEAIKARAEAACPGPWSNLTTPGDRGVDIVGYPHGTAYVARDLVKEDAAFIAHARQDVDDLVAAIERVRALCDDPHRWFNPSEFPGLLLVADVRAALDQPTDTTGETETP